MMKGRTKGLFDYISSRSRDLRWTLLGRIETGSGLNPEKRDRPVMVNMTSIPSRLNRVHLAIESLLRQRFKPDHVSLWISEQLDERELPSRIRRLLKRGLKIRFRRDVGPHTKIYYALQEFPECLHVTADDDHLYPLDWLECLYESWLSAPTFVNCGRARFVTTDEAGRVAPYRTWKFGQPGDGPSRRLMPLNYGGTVYCTDLLDSEAYNVEAMRRLCPAADDIWFYCMALRKGTPFRVIPRQFGPLNMITGTQAVSLHKENVEKDRNRGQMQATLDEYGLNPSDS